MIFRNKFEAMNVKEVAEVDEATLDNLLCISIRFNGNWITLRYLRWNIALHIILEWNLEFEPRTFHDFQFLIDDHLDLTSVLHK
jgi:hypothetical protein